MIIVNIFVFVYFHVDSHFTPVYIALFSIFSLLNVDTIITDTSLLFCYNSARQIEDGQRRHGSILYYLSFVYVCIFDADSPPSTKYILNTNALAFGAKSPYGSLDSGIHVM
jgi:hypothetical protein